MIELISIERTTAITAMMIIFGEMDLAWATIATVFGSAVEPGGRVKVVVKMVGGRVRVVVEGGSGVELRIEETETCCVILAPYRLIDTEYPTLYITLLDCKVLT